MFQEMFFCPIFWLFVFVFVMAVARFLFSLLAPQVRDRLHLTFSKLFNFVIPKSEMAQALLLLCGGWVFISAFVLNAIFVSHSVPSSDANDLLSVLDNLGSFLSGAVGSFFSLVSIVLIYLTFSAQLKNDKLQKFLTRYYTLLDLHRKNVEEILLKKYQGRIVFVRLIEELRYILQVINGLESNAGKCYSERTKMKIAYISLKYGVDEFCVEMLKKALRNYCNDEFINCLIEQLIAARQTTRRGAAKYLFRKNINKKYISASGKTFYDELEYLPFDGHQSRLTHYFQHIYQMIKYVDGSKLHNEDEKQEFIMTIMAQLSIYELATLCLNILTNTDKNRNAQTNAKDTEAEWYDYVNKYQIIKNLPTNFFNKETEIDVVSEFSGVIFES